MSFHYGTIYFILSVVFYNMRFGQPFVQVLSRSWGELGPQSPSNTVWPGLRPTSVPSGILNLDPSSRLTTTNMCREWGLCPFWGGSVPI